MFRVGFAGQLWDFDINEVAPKDVADLRRETGLRMADILSVDLATVDLDIAAALIFLARRQSDSRLIKFDAAVAGFTYGTPLELVAAAPDEDGDDHPEA